MLRPDQTPPPDTRPAGSPRLCAALQPVVFGSKQNFSSALENFFNHMVSVDDVLTDRDSGAVSRTTSFKNMKDVKNTVLSPRQ
ncbi:hypothetical protein OG535_00500 [Kitasatospora sp. NBC_00085]|uniref:hypothetical protein n=1 Tax=unclassified Kitasatospora TaxID=2633591 RepID=UPI002F90FDF6